MLRRAWTMVIGYMVTYASFPYIYQNNSSVKKFFPKDRTPYLLIGYIFFLYGITEISTWMIRKMAHLMEKFAYHNGLITENPVWLGCEIVWWYVVANFTILAYAELGQFYGQGQNKKLFSCGIFLALGAQYINWQFLPE